MYINGLWIKSTGTNLKWRGSCIFSLQILSTDLDHWNKPMKLLGATCSINSIEHSLNPLYWIVISPVFLGDGLVISHSHQFTSYWFTSPASPLSHWSCPVEAACRAALRHPLLSLLQNMAVTMADSWSFRLLFCNSKLIISEFQALDVFYLLSTTQ